MNCSIGSWKLSAECKAQKAPALCDSDSSLDVDFDSPESGHTSFNNSDMNWDDGGDSTHEENMLEVSCHLSGIWGTYYNDTLVLTG